MPTTPPTRFEFLARDGSRFSVIENPPLGMPQVDVDAQNAKLERDYQLEIRRAVFTTSYNCHGLSLVGKLGWLQGDQVRKLIACNNLTKIASCSNIDLDSIKPSTKVHIGDLVLYYDSTEANVKHTGVIVKVFEADEFDLVVMSKWGSYGEYFHSYKKVVPDYGKSLEIWSDRL